MLQTVRAGSVRAEVFRSVSQFYYRSGRFRVTVVLGIFTGQSPPHRKIRWIDR